MPDFVKSQGDPKVFGVREFLRSTKNLQFESYTLAASSVPADADGQKILQPGTALAKITSGPDIGKVGPFQAGVTDGRQTVGNLVGVNLTFLPWQLLERDVEVSSMTHGTAVQAWCVELDAGGAEVPLANATADAMRGTKRLDVNFS